MLRIRRTDEQDLAAMVEIINDAALSYRGVIPADCWRDPYMSSPELRAEIDDGVVFWGAEQDNGLLGVMGMQDKGDVVLVRHAYVIRRARGKGVGGALLRHVRHITAAPLLVGTWTAASWAIAFYERNGFIMVGADQKDALLRRYWSIPERQMEMSVVLADQRWVQTGERPV